MTAPRLNVWALRAYPAMEPTAQPNGHVCATCGPSTGSPTAKPKLGASYHKFGLGQGYPRDIRRRRQCCGRPVLRAEESVEGVSLHGVCMPRVTHPIGAGWPRSEPCFWRSALERRQTGLFGPRRRFAAVEAPKLSNRAGPARDRLEVYNM